MEPAHLHLVDAATGEATEVCPDCQGYQRIITGLMRQRTELENELRRRAEDDPRHDVISGVLSHFADRATETGWWSRRPVYEPGDGRWKATSAALNKKRTPEYLNIVIDGAFMEAEKERNSPRFKRSYLEPMTIFGQYIETHYEFAMDPGRQWVRAVLEAPASLRDRWQEVLDLADPCECSHARLDHQKPALTVDGLLTFGECLVHGCHCDGFDKDWFRDEKVAAWVARQERS